MFLAPTMLVVLIGTLMGYELLQTMWGYQQPRKPTAPLIRALASNLDMESFATSNATAENLLLPTGRGHLLAARCF